MTAPGDIEAEFSGTLGAFRLDASFTAPGSGITALFGPSGCGKTSVLRCIAGLTRLAGRCSVAGAVWQDEGRFLPPHRRPVGYVFQEASLFPHLSVRGNLLYAHRGKVPTGSDAPISFDDVIELLGLASLIPRAPQHLSGGERQRVAIGRALLSQPRLLLMDEPLSALDLATREEILPFLERLHETLAIPVFYVTHEIGEVERLADHLVFMQAGRVVAAGPLTELQSDIGLPLAFSRDAAVSLPATAGDYDPAYGLLKVEVDGASLLVPGRSHPAGTRLRLRIRAADVSLTTAPPGPTSILNVLPAVIAEERPLGETEKVVVLRLGVSGQGSRVLARITRRSWDALGLAVGTKIHAQIKSAALAWG
jgi:molybdenum ABC transporter, ATP-binding protein